MRSSSRSARSVAIAAAAPAGVPPIEANSEPSAANDSAISWLHTTADTGYPFPVDLARQTMSGTTPCISNPQKCEPSRPYPTCTSSAITTPPAARTAP